MYLRFITEFKNEQNELETGVFQAMGYLLHSVDMFQYDKQRLEEIRAWFNRNLEKPKRFNKHSNKNKSDIAISWFKDSAVYHITSMYDMVPIFDNYGIQIELIKRENPGYIIYEDDYQVVTIPLGKDRPEVL